MTRGTSSVLLLFVFALIAVRLPISGAVPASSFSFKNGDWYDNWEIDRNYYAGPNGYMPNLANETLNENKELSYSTGQKFQADYPDQTQRATAILKYVQRWTEYGYDGENVVRDGVSQEEWAWNADEMAHAINETTGVKAIGDCEDLAFLCGTIYVGAGFDAAIVDAVDHAALLIWLPDFSNANAFWDLPNDGRDAGWIWVEATGSSNPLGWTPPDYQNGGWTAYPIGKLGFVVEPVPEQSILFPFDTELLLTIAIVVFSIILALARASRH